MEKARIFNIERCSTEDGPGLRTTVFTKGCHLRCRWCANPESQIFKKEILFKSVKCIGCGRCMKACPENAISLKEGFGMISDIEKCTACGVCLDNCYVDARVLQGEDYTVDELMAILAKDETYYRKSGGGITFSGGEPLIYSSFIKACCGRIHDMGATVLIETCGEVETSHLEEILDCVDIIYCDFKHFDTEKHRLYTGRGNERIIENIKLMNEKFKGELSLRYPYIPGCNDEPEAIEAFLSFAEGLDKVKEVVFLPYHRLGLDKYNGLGRVYAMGDMPSLKIKDLDHLKAYEKTFNLKIKVM